MTIKGSVLYSPPLAFKFTKVAQLINPLRGVWAAGPKQLFVVGDKGTVAMINNNIVTTYTSGTSETLHGVWGSGLTDVYAVGHAGTVLHFDGTAWKAMDSGAKAALVRVWGAGPSDVYVVGAGGTVLRRQK